MQLPIHTVDSAPAEVQQVAAASPDDGRSARLEHPSETRNVALDRVGRGCRRLLAPQPLDEMLDPHQLPCAQHQERQNSALLPAAQRY